jgi:flagellar hook-basal body complex protein FliE
MSIQPINTSSLIDALAQKQNKTDSSDDFIPFSDILSDALNNVADTDTAAQIDAVNIATGKTDDLHTLTIDIAKADLALQMLVEVRNKALDAYNEIMRITM